MFLKGKNVQILFEKYVLNFIFYLDKPSLIQNSFENTILTIKNVCFFSNYFLIVMEERI